MTLWADGTIAPRQHPPPACSSSTQHPSLSLIPRPTCRKVLLLLVVAVANVLLLMCYRGFFSWETNDFHLDGTFLPYHPPPALKPKHTNVAFLKTHKTGSSTVQNILFRFAERHNLTVAFPIESCGNLFCYPKSFSHRFVHPGTLPANIITNHMRFNKKELQQLMPKDTIYVTILREPGSMFESSFSYFGELCESFSSVPGGSMEAFLNEPLRYYQPHEPYAMLAHNNLAFDLGGDHNHLVTDLAYAQTLLEDVEQDFSLVMIADYFDESLILLRHLLSWDVDDVLYMELNKRTPSSKQTLTPELTRNIRAWNSLDTHLYDHFNASLWRQLSALGADYVAEELGLLREARERLTRTCFGESEPHFLDGGQIKNPELRPWQPPGKAAIAGYSLPESLSASTQEFCLKFIVPELRYAKALLQSELQRSQKNSDT